MRRWLSIRRWREGGWQLVLAAFLWEILCVESFAATNDPGRLWSNPAFPKVDVAASAFQKKKPLLCLCNMDHETPHDKGEKIMLEPKLTDYRVQELFSVISCVLLASEELDEVAALQAVFGPASIASPGRLPAPALALYPITDVDMPAILSEFTIMGPAFSDSERQGNSLGPLGAGQWSKQYPEKFAHSVLRLDGTISSVHDWISSLPRTTRQTMRKTESTLEDNGLFCSTRVIDEHEPAPHSTLNHFRCVLEHEVRLATSNYMEGEQDYGIRFFDAVLEALERYAVSVQMTGSILEYRDTQTKKVLAFCHVVGKGKTLRGQWFYMSNDGLHKLLWFHSVKWLVEYGLHCGHCTAVDLGPNGTDGRLDAHAKLKEKLGFRLYDDWPTVCDYRGDFWKVEVQAT